MLKIWDRYEKTPSVPQGTEGEKVSRYHLCSRRPHGRTPRAVRTHGGAVTGAPGARLLGRRPFGCQLRGVFAGPRPPLSTRPEALLRAAFPGTSPHHCCNRYFIRFFPACQQADSGRLNSDKVLFSFARGRERCDRNGHAVFLRPGVDFATTGSEITGISTSSTKLK